MSWERSIIVPSNKKNSFIIQKGYNMAKNNFLVQVTFEELKSKEKNIYIHS